MSFSSAVKDDLARVSSSRHCCRLAEFAAFFRMCGRVHIAGAGKISLTMTTEHAAAARKAFSSSRELFGLKSEILVHRKSALRKNQIYTVMIPAQEGIGAMFAALGLMDLQRVWESDFPGPFAPSLVESECCRRAYLRGAFLGGGSVNDPEGAYHLEFATGDLTQGQFICDLLHDLGLGGKVTARKQGYVVYLKAAEQIVDLLALMGSHRSLLQFENVRVAKDMRNRITREVNCESANINKTVNAAIRQKQAIELINDKLGLSKLPPSLAAAASLRLENPEASLAELAAEAGISRSAVNHRLRRLVELAEDLQNGEPTSFKG